MPINPTYAKRFILPPSKLPRASRKSRPPHYYRFRRCGRHVFRIGPPWFDTETADPTWVARTLGGLVLPVHRHINLPDLRPREAPVCIRRTFPGDDRPCPICKFDDPDLPGAVLWGKERLAHGVRLCYYTNVLVREGSPDKAPHDQWSIGSLRAEISKWLCGQLSTKAGRRLVLERDVVVEKLHWYGRYYHYECGFAPSPTPLHPDPLVADNVLTGGVHGDLRPHDLDRIFRVSDKRYAEIEDYVERLRKRYRRETMNVAARSK